MIGRPDEHGVSLRTAGPHVLRRLAAHAKAHRAPFVRGALCALVVVGLRLALPWPLRGVHDIFFDRDFQADGYAWLPSWIDPVLALGGAFFLLVSILGVFDLFERLYFARFAIGTVRDLRARAFRALVEASSEQVSLRKGDLVSRLIGDTARVKTGIQGFLVHVATNGVLLLGVIAILIRMDVYLGLVFAMAAAVTLAVTAWGAARMFHATIEYRTKEGELADQIEKSIRKGSGRSRFKTVNKSSGHHEASQTRTQGIVTSTVHAIFGIAVLVAIWLGTRVVGAGRMELGDIVVFLMYVVMLRSPIVILARQGSRTGKILGASYRLAQIVDLGTVVQASADDRPGSEAGTATSDTVEQHGSRIESSNSPSQHPASTARKRMSVRQGLEILFTG